MEITFSGASDDLVHIYGAPGADEFSKDSIDGEWNVLSVQKGLYSGAWDIVSPSEGRMRVHAIYDGCWAFAPGLCDEDDILPAWNIALRPSATAYSVSLAIHVPDDARIVATWK